MSNRSSKQDRRHNRKTKAAREQKRQWDPWPDLKEAARWGSNLGEDHPRSWEAWEFLWEMGITQPHDDKKRWEIELAEQYWEEYRQLNVAHTPVIVVPD